MKLLVINGLRDWFLSLGLTDEHALLLAAVAGMAGLLLLAWVVFFVLNRVIIHYLNKLAKRTRTTWDNILFEKKVFRRLSHLVPAILIHHMSTVVLGGYATAIHVTQIITYLYMVVAAILVINSIINSFEEIYNTMPVSENRSVKGLVQVVKIFVYILGTGIIVSIILQKNLTSFFAGLGAMAAVIMLVFKDTILGFVAGIQLTANDMVRLGDWLEMPGRGADGEVFDITLNTVKVRNWDKTISTIPPYALVTESFTNWRGMEESGGRRIKRAVNIDMKSIHFLSKEEIDKFRKIQIIRDYIDRRQVEVEEYNREHGVDDSVSVNGRRLTNIGTFRMYIVEYLKRHPKIHNDMTFLVRHLQPTDKGLPIEIYVFSNDQRWAFYEDIQADIFDHILAVIPQFGLSVYQSPSGDDIARLAVSQGLG